MDEVCTMAIDAEPVVKEATPDINDNSSPLIKSRGKVDLSEVCTYLRQHVFPGTIVSKGDKANFKRQCRPFSLKDDGTMMYRKKVKDEITGGKCINLVEVILKSEDQKEIVRMIHQGSETSDQACALSAHRGVISSLREVSKRFYWPNFTKDVKDFIGTCEICQKVNHGSRLLKVVPELNPVGVPKKVMAQIGIDLATLPEINGFHYLVVAIDYFSKWTEAKALPDKTARSVASFLFDIICRHGCISVQINDQGREFVNAVSAELHRLTGVKQRVTSAYHPQANGLVERQNRTIKNSFLKVLNENARDWPNIVDSVLFAHRTVKHFSTGFSPFYMLYQREAILPVDLRVQSNISLDEDSDNVDNDLEDVEGNSSNSPETPFDMKEYSSMLEGILKVRDQVHDQAMDNIHASQKKQKYYYDQRHSTSNVNKFKAGDKVLLRNLRKADRKGGWSESNWNGPYVLNSVRKNNCVLYNEKTKKLLAKKHNISNLKMFKERNESEEKINISNVPEEKPEEDVKILSVSNHCELRFVPVDFEWQKEKCAMLELKLEKRHGPWSVASKPLNAPKRVAAIIGDGNCFFRCLSLLVTGCQEQHGQLRALLVKYMQENSEAIDNYNQQNDYIVKSRMGTWGTWATDAEILAASAWLKTTIYVYSQYGHELKWQKFAKHVFSASPNKADFAERSLYIINRCMHYEVVEDVER